MKPNGKLIQLIPSNIYKNVFAEKLRNLLKEHISTIFEYPSQKFFDETLTSTSIFLYDRNYNDDFICYRNETDQIELQIKRDSLVGKWMFSESSTSTGEAIRFGDVFNASIVIATLLNEAFIVSAQEITEKGLEKAILKQAGL